MPRILCLTDDPAICADWLPRCQALDSGTHRTRAHKFHFTKGLVVSSFAFSKPLD